MCFKVNYLLLKSTKVVEHVQIHDLSNTSITTFWCFSVLIQLQQYWKLMVAPYMYVCVFSKMQKIVNLKIFTLHCNEINIKGLSFPGIYIIIQNKKINFLEKHNTKMQLSFFKLLLDFLQHITIYSINRLKTVTIYVRQIWSACTLLFHNIIS